MCMYICILCILCIYVCSAFPLVRPHQQHILRHFRLGFAPLRLVARCNSHCSEAEGRLLFVYLFVLFMSGRFIFIFLNHHTAFSTSFHTTGFLTAYTCNMYVCTYTCFFRFRHLHLINR